MITFFSPLAIFAVCLLGLAIGLHLRACFTAQIRLHLATWCAWTFALLFQFMPVIAKPGWPFGKVLATSVLVASAIIAGGALFVHILAKNRSFNKKYTLQQVCFLAALGCVGLTWAILWTTPWQDELKGPFSLIAFYIGLLPLVWEMEAIHKTKEPFSVAPWIAFLFSFVFWAAGLTWHWGGSDLEIFCAWIQVALVVWPLLYMARLSISGFGESLTEHHTGSGWTGE